MSDFLSSVGLADASGFSITVTRSAVSSRIMPTTFLPAVVSNDQVRYLSSILSDGSSISRSTSVGFHFGSSLVRSGPNSRPTPPSLWQLAQVATWKSCLPLANERPPTSPPAVGSGRRVALADFLEATRQGEHEVVRHQVVVFEDDLDGFSGAYDQAVDVIPHLLGHGADAQHADAQFAQFLADGLRLIQRQRRG